MSEAVFFSKLQLTAKTPFRMGSREIRERACLIFRIGDRYSEAAPLGTHSHDSLEENLIALNALGSSGFHKAIDGLEVQVPPALSFAIECLRERELPREHAKLRCNAMIPWRGIDESFEKVRDLVSAGYECIKLKAPPGTANDLARVIEKAKELEVEIRFRVDPNRSWQAREFFEFERNCAQKKLLQFIEYIEEPCASLREISSSTIPLAADESADTLENIELLSTHGIGVFILKPTVLGGRAWRIADSLKQRGKTVVFTSCMESSIGRRHLVHKLMLNKYQGFAGIGTGHLFSPNFLPDLATYTGPQLMGPEERNFMETMLWTPLT